MSIFRISIENMHPYIPPLAGRTNEGVLLLDFNERRKSPHPLVVSEIMKELSPAKLKVYPEYKDLDEIISAYVGVNPDQIMPTNGSYQAIDVIYRALVQKNLHLASLSNPLQQRMQSFIESLSESEKWELEGDHIIKSTPTFTMLDQAAKLQEANSTQLRYTGSDLHFPFDEVMRAIRPGIKLVEICNPNNPTGTPVPREQTEAIIEKASQNNAAVLVDEAYHEFAPELTVIDLVNRYNNLFITRSFSKNMGIARLRAGCAISQRENIDKLRNIRGPYDINSGAVGAMRALRYPEVRQDIKDYIAEVMGLSKPMVEAFYDRNGIRYYPSVAGFHLLEAPGLSDFLTNRDGTKILLRPRSDPAGTVRVSIGTQADTKQYIETFSDFLKRQ